VLIRCLTADASSVHNSLTRVSGCFILRHGGAGWLSRGSERTDVPCPTRAKAHHGAFPDQLKSQMPREIPKIGLPVSVVVSASHPCHSELYKANAPVDAAAR